MLGLWRVAALLLGSATCVFSACNVPLSPDAHSLVRVGDAASPLAVDIYLDLACGDCASAWPTITAAISKYSETALFTVRLFPLPYHRAAHNLAITAQLIKVLEPQSLLPFISTVFHKQASILNDAVADVGDAAVADVLYSWLQASTSISISREQFGTSLKARDVDIAARNEFKYAALHGVYGTPSIAVGGVFTDFDASNSAEWDSTLEPLLRSRVYGAAGHSVAA
jgi:protein-disulfide isomerase